MLIGNGASLYNYQTTLSKSAIPAVRPSLSFVERSEGRTHPLALHTVQGARTLRLPIHSTAHRGLSALACHTSAHNALTEPLHVRVKHLGLQPYEEVWQEMQRFVASSSDAVDDEIWVVQHPPVFTLGLNGERSHILSHSDIPVVHSDRGGEVTYHGPGQLVVYPMIDLKRRGIDVRQLVTAIEKATVDTLAEWGIAAYSRADAPGVYVKSGCEQIGWQEKKIGSLGLRIKKFRSYHGLALNVAMDLKPFQHINPCGYAGMQMTQVIDELIPENGNGGNDGDREKMITNDIATCLVNKLQQRLENAVTPN